MTSMARLPDAEIKVKLKPDWEKVGEWLAIIFCVWLFIMILGCASIFIIKAVF
jgi:hypothetical protein